MQDKIQDTKTQDTKIQDTKIQDTMPDRAARRSLRIRTLTNPTLLTFPPFCYVRCRLKLRFAGRHVAANSVYRSFTAIS